jgi:hypothetical protein
MSLSYHSGRRWQEATVLLDFSSSSCIWFAALLFGVFGIKGAFLIERIVTLLQGDIIVVGNMGQWGPSSRITETYR